MTRWIDLKALPYIVDFGYVVKGTEVYNTVLLEPYGPIGIDIIVKVHHLREFRDHGFRIACTHLLQDNMYELVISFRPTKEKYKEMDNKAQEVVTIQVSPFSDTYKLIF